MKTFDERERAAYRAVDEALHTLPLKPPPAGLSAAVLTRIRQFTPPPFRLAWLDYSLGLLVLLMLGVLLTLWFYAPSTLRQQVSLELALWAHYMRLWVATPGLLVGLGVAGVSLVALGAWAGGRPQFDASPSNPTGFGGGSQSF